MSTTLDEGAEVGAASERFTNSIKIDLEELFATASYHAIRELGLYESLECEEWDDLADRLGKQAHEFVKDLIEQEMVGGAK